MSPWPPWIDAQSQFRFFFLLNNIIIYCGIWTFSSLVYFNLFLIYFYLFLFIFIYDHDKSHVGAEVFWLLDISRSRICIQHYYNFECQQNRHPFVHAIINQICPIKNICSSCVTWYDYHAHPQTNAIPVFIYYLLFVIKILIISRVYSLIV